MNYQCMMGYCWEGTEWSFRCLCTRRLLEKYIRDTRHHKVPTKSTTVSVVAGHRQRNRVNDSAMSCLLQVSNTESRASVPNPFPRLPLAEGGNWSFWVEKKHVPAGSRLLLSLHWNSETHDYYICSCHSPIEIDFCQTWETRGASVR